jgi:hypothetical protein
MRPHRRRRDQPLIASGTAACKPEPPLGSSDQKIEVGTILKGQRFVTL